MINTTGSDSRIESYLARVRAALHGLPEREVDDILRELQSHAFELAEGQGVEAALRSLGDPVDLATTYRAENAMVRAECASSPLVILQGLRNTTRSRTRRVTVTALYIFGYAMVVALWASAVDKIFSPSRTGLWYTPGNFWPIRLLADENPPAEGRELLGWWLIPIVIAAGWILRYGVDLVAQWWIRRARQMQKFRAA